MAQRPRVPVDETFSLMAGRWNKLHKDFYSPATGRFDLSKASRRFLSVCLFVCLSVCLSVYLSVSEPASQAKQQLSVCLCLSVSVCLSKVCMCVCLSFSSSLYLSVTCFLFNFLVWL